MKYHCFFTILFLLIVSLVLGEDLPLLEEKELSVAATQTDSIPNTEGLYALLISKEGNLLQEQYFNGQSEDSLFHVQSLAKGLMSMLIGMVIDQGLIENEDVRIEQYLPAYFEGIEEAGKREITIAHLLNQTSGLSWKGYLEHEDWLSSEDPITYVLQKELQHQPGTVYNYNSGASHLLSAIIAKASGQSVQEFAERYLFNPLGISEYDWAIRNDGHQDGSGLGLKMKAADLLKLGQLLANDGYWEGKSLLSSAWIDKLFDEGKKKETAWGIRGSSHGFCWYKAQFQGEIIDYGMGYGGQFIFLVRDKGLLIVCNHNHDTPKGIEQQIGFIYKRLPALLASAEGQ